MTVKSIEGKNNLDVINHVNSADHKRRKCRKNRLLEDACMNIPSLH